MGECSRQTLCHFIQRSWASLEFGMCKGPASLWVSRDDDDWWLVMNPLELSWSTRFLHPTAHRYIHWHVSQAPNSQGMAIASGIEGRELESLLCSQVPSLYLRLWPWESFSTQPTLLHPYCHCLDSEPVIFPSSLLYFPWGFCTVRLSPSVHALHCSKKQFLESKIIMSVPAEVPSGAHICRIDVSPSMPVWCAWSGICTLPFALVQSASAPQCSFLRWMMPSLTSTGVQSAPCPNVDSCSLLISVISPQIFP